MKTIRTLFLVLLTYSALAQEQVNYKVTIDQPRKVNNFSCNIDLLQMDAGLGNIDGISFNTGVWGHAMYKQKMGLDYTFRYGTITLGKFASATAKSHINIQTGGFFIFSQRDPMSTNKVVLKTEGGGTTSDGRSITKVTYLMVPSHKWKYTAVRGGIYFNRSMVRLENPTGADNFSNYFLLGAYGGICFGSSKQVLIQTDKYGEKGNLLHMRVCLDALITPINNVPAGVKHALPIGARLLVQGLPSLERKLRKKKYKAGLTYEFEGGYRMVDGPYIACTLSIPISRSIKALSTKEEDKTPKRTTE
jgi:hypothetical protein